MRLSGSATSLPQGTSRPAMSMNGALSMSDRTTSTATLSATSLQALEDGPTLLDWLDGLTTANSGPEVALASLSVSLAPEKAKPTNVTSGRRSSTSSAQSLPQSSWESKLRLRLESIGSTECVLTWKASATPSGRQLSRLVPSMRPTGEIASGLWPTPAASDGMRGGTITEAMTGQSLPQRVNAVLWPTPTAMDHARGLTARPQDTGTPLPQMIARALWSTPRASPNEPYHEVHAVAVGGQARRLLGGTGHWLIGADGKARRVEPGIRLLAHGVPARVGKLRAYGNAIVPQVAAEVIGAYLDAERLAA
jgi:hypothetical protein